MASIATVVRQRLKAEADALPGFTPSQNVLGAFDFAPAVDFFANIQTTGPWLFIRPEYGQADGPTSNSTFVVDCELIFGFTNDATQDFTGNSDLIALLEMAWMSYSPWTKGGVIGPREMTWQSPEVKWNIKPAVARTQISLTFAAVADQASGQRFVTTNRTNITTNGKYVLTGAA